MLTGFDSFLAAYIECALWSTNDESDESGGDPLNKNYGPEHLTKAARKRITEDCEAFYHLFSKAWQHGPLFPKAGSKPYTCADAGHDFWLTRNGHGSGFWDRDNIGSYAGYDVAEMLTAAAKACGGVNLSVYRGRIDAG